LLQLVKQNCSFFNILQSEHFLSVQCSFQLLSRSAIPKMNYLLRVSEPAAIKEAATWFDQQVRHTLQQRLKLRQHYLQDTAINTLYSLPVSGKCPGFGIRSVCELSPFAFVASQLSNINRDQSFWTNYFQLPTTDFDNSHLKLQIIHIHSLFNQDCKYLPPSTVNSSTLLSFLKKNSDTVATLQHSLTHQWEQQQEEKLLIIHNSSANQLQKAAWKSSSLPATSDWLLAIPTMKELVIRDEAFRLAARQRLGIEPSDTLHETTKCQCGNLFKTDPYHHLSCILLKRTAINDRHDAIRNLFERCARQVNVPSQREPTGWCVNDDKRPDLLLAFSHKVLLTDVTIVNPLAHSFIQRTVTDPTYCIHQRTKEKTHKYREIIERGDADFNPLVFTSFGAYGKEVETLLHQLNTLSNDEYCVFDSVETTQLLRFGIACVIQNGNQRVYRECMCRTGFATDRNMQHGTLRQREHRDVSLLAASRIQD